MDINKVLGQFAGAASYNVASFKNAAFDSGASTREIDTSVAPPASESKKSIFKDYGPRGQS